MTWSFIIGLIGNVTTGLVYLAPVKTFWHIVKKRSTGEFESIPYIFKLTNAYFWTYYGIVKPNSIVVATINGFGVALEIVFIVIFLLFANPKMRIPNGSGFALGAVQLILYAMYCKPKTVSSLDGLAAPDDDLEEGRHNQEIHQPLLLPPPEFTPTQHHKN